MAVVGSAELIGMLSKSESVKDNSRSYVVRYQVTTNDVDDGALTVEAATGIPARTAYMAAGNDVDLGAFVDSYSTSHVSIQDTRQLWHVDVTYKTPDDDKNECSDETIDDPLDKPAEISGSGVKYVQAILKDKDGAAVKNAAGDFFDDLTRDESRPTLVITQNQATVDLAQFMEYADAVNTDVFFGLAARSWKMSFPKWKRLYYGTCNAYYRVTYEFEASGPELWDVAPVERGWFHLDGGDRKVFVDADGKQLNAPGLLDAAGAKLAVGADPVFVNPPFRVYPEKPFASLNIPTTL